jgi:hypothetical protein
MKIWRIEGDIKLPVSNFIASETAEAAFEMFIEDINKRFECDVTFDYINIEMEEDLTK